MEKYEQFEKVLMMDLLLDELSKIRNEMDHNSRKAKQQLTNLIHNLRKKLGRCFKVKEISTIDRLEKKLENTQKQLLNLINKIEI